MEKPLIIFGISKPNVYSFAKILGALEIDDEIMEKFEIITIRNSIFEQTFDHEFFETNNFDKRPFIILPFSLFTTQLPMLKKFTEKIYSKLKEINPNVIVIAGGWQTIGNPKITLDSGVHFAIIGESEVALPSLLKKIYNFYQTYPNSILGENIKDFKLFHEIEELVSQQQQNHIAFYSDNKLIRADRKYPSDNPMNSIDLNDYPPYSENFRVFCPIEISRGCPFRCKFCQTGNYWDKMRHANVETIVKWIKRAVEIRYDRVWFTSPNSFAYGAKNGVGTNPSAVERLLKGLKNIPNLQEIFFGSFPSEVRPEYVTKEMMDTVFPYVSNKYFTIGAQTASDELLKKINRGHTFEQVLNGMDLILDYGYIVDLDFMFGLPGETDKDLDITIEFFNQILSSKKRVRIHTHTFLPLPGTPYENEISQPLKPELKEIVGRLAVKNQAYGSYQKQARIARKNPQKRL